MEKINRLRSLKSIDRLSGVFKHRNYNLLEHSYMVATLFKEFASKENVPYTMAEFDLVLNHDLVESITGDLSYEVKNSSEATKQHWEEIEEEVITPHPKLSRYLDSYIKGHLTERQYLLLKTCDTLDLWIFLKEEVAMGNNTVRVHKIITTCEELFQKYASSFPAVNKFIKEYQI